MKSGNIITEKVNLDGDFSQAINVGKVRISGPFLLFGAKGWDQPIRSLRCKKRGKGSDNKNTAKWRSRRGGAWLMPPNKRFKTGK